MFYFILSTTCDTVLGDYCVYYCDYFKLTSYVFFTKSLLKEANCYLGFGTEVEVRQ